MATVVGAALSGAAGAVGAVLPAPPAPRYGRPDDASQDAGLFGPGSITWQIHGDPAAALGGVRALLLQALDPESMAGLAASSDYRDEAWGRLFRTAEYVGTITFGTSEEAERAAAIVRAVHRRLGVDRPRLLLWVHAGFVDSMLEAYRRCGLPLTAAEADAYVAEQRIAARLVGLDPSTVFDTEAGLRAYLDAQRAGGRLQTSDLAREGARFIVAPPMAARVELLTPARLAWTGLAATAFGLLPGWARRMYGTAAAGGVGGAALGGLPLLTDWQVSTAAKAWRRTVLAIPEHARTGPHVRAAHQRLGLVPPQG